MVYMIFPISRCLRSLGLVLESNPVPFYVSASWLVRFLTCADPGPITNSSDLLCAHGAIRPGLGGKVKLLKAVPVSADCWQVLFSR